MEKPTKAEIEARKRLVANIVKSEGWPFLKGLAEEWAMHAQNDIRKAETSEEVTAGGYKYKFGVQALTEVLSAAELIKEELDK